MSRLLFWPTITFFYPVGNTSAVCLTENMTPGEKTDILLLACGDPRHILYTVHVNETSSLMSSRVLDITCCDADVAILARNALLFTLLADDGAPDKLDNFWNLFYNMFVDQSTLSILFGQCRKLIKFAESLETWRAGPYGHFITTCDAATLGGLRRVWTEYLGTASFTSKQAKQFEKRFLDGMKEVSCKIGLRATMTATRSAGPFAPHVIEAVTQQHSNYWSSGVTDSDSAYRTRQEHGQKNLSINPTFAFSIEGDKFAVHYGTDPLSGFHLAEAFTSGKFTSPDERIPPAEVVRIAKDQFSRWCTSMSKRLKGNNPSSRSFMIRMFAGDVLMFSQALKYCGVTQSAVTPYNVSAWRLATITLNSHFYGLDAPSPAPLSFDVIDTSNILDHVGLLNILVVTAPLLRKTSSATLYTESLLRLSQNPSQDILQRLCGNLPTMALLLGIIPSTAVSQLTTRCNSYEATMSSASLGQYYERLAWGPVGLGGRRDAVGTLAPPQRPCFQPEQLGLFFYCVYLSMFVDEDVESRFKLFFSPESFLHGMRHSSLLHYDRRSFVLFVQFVKTRVQTDWQRTMELFEDLVLNDEKLITGKHAYHELCCQLHLLGVYTTPWLSVTALNHPLLHRNIIFGDTFDDNVNLGLFREWNREQIPQVVTLVFVVPRSAVAKLEPQFKDGTPMLQCDMQDGPRQHWFAAITATCGSLRVSGTGESRTGMVIEGATDSGTNRPAARGMKPLWRTGAPLIITFSVPAFSVMDFAQNSRATIGLTFRPTMAATAKFSDRLGYDLMLFRTELANTERVFVLAQRPIVVSVSQANAGMVNGPGFVRDHWKEDWRVAYSEPFVDDLGMPRSLGTDVYVLMSPQLPVIQSLIVRIDVTEPAARATLANAETVPIITSTGSGSTMRSLGACVKVGTHTYTVHFPLPVDVGHARLRVARQSSFIEVVAPPASFHVRPERDLLCRLASLSSDHDHDGTPTLGSIHRVNLDRCITFQLPKNLVVTPSWYDRHLALMFPELEKRRAIFDELQPQATSIIPDIASVPDTLLHVKQTLQVLLGSAVGASLNGQPLNSVFALSDTSRGVAYVYIVIARMCLDVGSHTVVMDAFVAPATSAVQEALAVALKDASSGDGQGSQNTDDVSIGHIDTDADEIMAWYHLLPRQTERCRTWPHKATCAYRTIRKDMAQLKSEDGSPDSVGMWARRSPLCACGEGVGTEVLPKQLKQVAPHLTRAGFSPLFLVPYLREAADMPLCSPGRILRKKVTLRRIPRYGLNELKKGTSGQCRVCGKAGGLVCSRCKEARYCSEACQHVDWKIHKKNCRDAGQTRAGEGELLREGMKEKQKLLSLDDVPKSTTCDEAAGHSPFFPVHPVDYESMSGLNQAQREGDLGRQVESASIQLQLINSLIRGIQMLYLLFWDICNQYDG